MLRETQSRSRESCCQTFFPMTLAALHLSLMAGRSATMLSTPSSPFTQMGRLQEMVSDRMAICSKTSPTSGRHTKADAPPLSARRKSDRGASASNLLRIFCQQFCQHDGPVSCVFHSFQESRRTSKNARNRPKTGKIITEET